ncbi:DUF4384 domain-containing protein [candidate division KSB1 bacterium]|nr:DUF4384 domain-containing protein [candidate division KSB1 bacterium]
METFALFADQSAYAISFLPLNVGDHEKVDRIQLKSFIEDDAVNDSAMKGIWAAYSILEKISQRRFSRRPNYLFGSQKSTPIIPESKKYYLVCDLEKSSLKRQVTGESAGLAFCLKFVQHVLAQQKSIDGMPAVAATGILDNRLETARIEKVESINDKIRAALSVLQQGDYFFYPKENEAEIDDDLKDALVERQIKGIAVERVQDAINLYLEHVAPDTIARRPGLSIRKMAIVLLILVMTSLLYVFYSRPTLDKVRKNLENGNFVRAADMFERIDSADLAEEEQESLRLLSGEMIKPLFAEIRFEYFTAEDDRNSSMAKPLTSLSNVTLTMEDSYRFLVKPSGDCFFYIVQFDSRDGVELLFPLAAFSVENHFLRAGEIYEVPGGGNTFYLLDGTHQGTVTLYFLATAWRASDIERALEAYDASRQTGKEKLRDFILERISERVDAPTKGVNGVFVRKEYFLQK